MTDEDIPISPSSTHKSCTSERPPLSLQALARVMMGVEPVFGKRWSEKRGD